MTPCGKCIPNLSIILLMAMVIGGCSSGPYTYEHYQDKIDKKEISIKVLGGSLNPSYAEMNLEIQYEGDDKFEFIIPSGTLFTSNDYNTQNMISARDVVVSFPGGSTNQIQNIAVESFCINFFLDPPTLNTTVPSVYSNDLMNVRYSTTVYGDAIWTLNKCLEEKSEDHSVKQMAIWLVSDGLLDMSREEVTNKLEEHYYAKTHKALELMREELGGEDFTDLPDADLIAAIEALVPADSLIAYGLDPDVLHPENIARREVAAFFENAGPLLTDCDIDINSKRFFQN